MKIIRLSINSAAFTYHWFNRQVQYTLAIFAFGVINILTTQVNGMNQFLILNWFSGCASAFVDIATNVWVLELFSSKNVNLHMQLVYFAYTLGKPKSHQNDFYTYLMVWEFEIHRTNHWPVIRRFVPGPCFQRIRQFDGQTRLLSSRKSNWNCLHHWGLSIHMRIFGNGCLLVDQSTNQNVGVN